MKIIGIGPPETPLPEFHPQEGRFNCVFCKSPIRSIDNYYYHIMSECSEIGPLRERYIKISRIIIFYFLFKIKHLMSSTSNEDLFEKLKILSQNINKILNNLERIKENFDGFSLIKFFLGDFELFF